MRKPHTKLTLMLLFVLIVTAANIITFFSLKNVFLKENGRFRKVVNRQDILMQRIHSNMKKVENTTSSLKNLTKGNKISIDNLRNFDSSLEKKLHVLSTNVTEHNKEVSVLRRQVRLSRIIFDIVKDRDLLMALQKCSWKSGEGAANGNFGTEVTVGNRVDRTECMKLCIKKSASYNGAIYLIARKKCSCLSNMNERDTDNDYVSCYIR